MALNIVRHDITRIKADAIVNSTNENFIVGAWVLMPAFIMPQGRSCRNR